MPVIQLNVLLKSAGITHSSSGNLVEISNIAIDSRKVSKGSLFVAIKGSEQDGHKYIRKAIDAGASAIVCQEKADVPDDILMVLVEDSADAAGRLASAFYGHPSEALKLVGVTGTNGKTTTVTLLYQLMKQLGHRTGLISTIENIVNGRVVVATHTTPDPVELNALLAEMVAVGCEYAFMEVSSHAAHQKRISGLRFEGAVFTNITHDHLDYHKTFDDYIAAKKSFFDGLASGSFALVNGDDRRSDIMLQNTKASKHFYSLRRSSEFKGKIFENTLEGLEMEIDGLHAHLLLIGEFNAYNALCAYGICRLLGFEREVILTGLSALPGARGRFETVRDMNRGVLYIVDYAHTPDALEKVLKTIEVMKQKGGIITVVGCGGHRDKEKRPKMGAIAASLSREAIFTDDNPRDENPADITAAMMDGVDDADRNKVLIINDRAQAIKTAAKLASRGDIVLVAGKGHETYQEGMNGKIDFDDRRVIEDIIGR
ncbi:MAG TPA: UDP-N-acetylmuramoyl-L-alanyl-D-glutamate--2,6-diaminopimelate ligase [Saprospiraceae bacterium]|nr:UDP-N-acetylmuramoyl-L-alanyl-D-glutamate--2,6-diaminopimelate ligase [Saprospiraceae bacterium]